MNSLRVGDNQEFRERVLEQWRDFRGHWRWMVYPCLGIGIGTALFELLHLRTAIEDAPLLLLAGLLVGVNLMSIFVLILAWTVGVETFRWTQERAEGRWVARRRELRPNESFMIPTWRFRLIGFLPASLVVVIMLVLWTLFTLTIPRQFEPVADAMDLLWTPDD